MLENMASPERSQLMCYISSTLRILFVFLDFILWIASGVGPFQVLMRLVNVQSKPVDHDVATRRNAHPADAVTTRSGATAHDLLQRSFQMHGKFNAMGIRQFVGTHIPSFGRGLDPLHVYQGISWISYDDVSSKSRAFGLGLCRLGLSPLPIEKSVACTDGFESLDGPHTLILFEHTSAEWLIAAVAAMTQSFTIVTIQASLGLVAVSEAINQCHAPAILCNYSDVKRMISLTASCPSLHTIIYSRNNVLDQEPPLLQTVTAGGRKIELRSFGDVLESGGSQEGSFTPPRPEHLALITYTSGVTGKPKGVMIKHKALVASITGLFSILGPVLKPSTKSFQEVYLAFLPSSHSLEFVMEIGMLIHGGVIGFSDDKAFLSHGAVLRLGTDVNAPLTRIHAGGIDVFSPTIILGTPKTWSLVQQEAKEEVDKANLIVQAAFAARSWALSKGRSQSALSSLVLHRGLKITDKNCLKVCISSGSPLAADVQQYVRVALNVNLVQLYGLTETSGIGAVQCINKFEGTSRVGPPVPGLTIRLRSCLNCHGEPLVLDREGDPYLSTDRVHFGSSCLGRGEVLIRGEAVSSGYYSNKSLTTSDFDEEGWFHTGDVGVWNAPSGELKIVDRLKNLLKLKGGDYVALESMESTFNQSAFVNVRNGGVMCYADAEMDHPIALVQASEYDLKRWADERAIGYLSFEELCQNPEAVEMVTDDLNDIGQGRFRRGSGASRNLVHATWAPNIYLNARRDPLGANETLAWVALLPGTGIRADTGRNAPWTTENGLLTASGKLNRRHIEENFADLIALTKLKAVT